ncbi:MAG TPA: polyprenol phosphomannose-dependent alpha 1,6 mannosyltransferase MptB [Pedococcus sp.]|jgi:alpha-1,6-mannosyltransferase|nr:polyprenol phosphomannose-dependent alpha 1,6 mannosyltransferase MptB [Pedococcus sp.]
MARWTSPLPHRVLPFLERWQPARQDVTPTQWRWIGCGAGIVLAGSSWLCGATPKELPSVWPGVIAWRPRVGGSPLAATALFLAMAAMLYAWWALRDADLSVGWVQRTATAWFAPLLASAPLFSRDVYSYAVTGLQLLSGGDPYHQGVRHLVSPWVSSVSKVWLDTPAPYGPAFMLLTRVTASAAQGHLLVAVALFRLTVVASVVVIAWAIPATARALGTDPVKATWLTLLTPLVGAHLVAGIHNDGLMVAGMVASVALALRRRHVWACLVLALAIAIKVPAVIAVPFVALIVADHRTESQGRTWWRLVRVAAVVGLGTVAAFVVLSLLSGLGFSWIAALNTPGASIQWTSLPTALGMGVGAIGTVFGHNVEHGAVTVLRDLALVALAATLIVLWLRAAREAHDSRAVVRYAGLAMLAVIVLSPAFHGWYLLWALPLLATTVDRRRWVTALALVASLMCVFVLPGGYGLALVTTWVGVPLYFVATPVLVMRAVSWARSYAWGELFSLAGAGTRTHQPSRSA